jgi:hypothetical protein
MSVELNNLQLVIGLLDETDALLEEGDDNGARTKLTEATNKLYDHASIVLVCRILREANRALSSGDKIAAKQLNFAAKHHLLDHLAWLRSQEPESH